MDEKGKEVLNDYKEMLSRKERRIEKLHNLKKERELNQNEELTLSNLSTEKQLIQTFIEDLEYIQE